DRGAARGSASKCSLARMRPAPGSALRARSSRVDRPRRRLSADAPSSDGVKRTGSSVAVNEASNPSPRSLSARAGPVPAALRPSESFAPAGLGPELVPGVEVLEVLATVSHLAVLEFEDDAVGNIEVLAVSVRGAALDADHAVITICSHVLQLGPEGPVGLLRQLAEVRQGGAAALVVAGHRAAARQMPHSLIHELGERVHVAGI